MESGATFAWNGDSELGGDTGGIPRFLPLGMGKEFYNRVDATINREIERTVRLRHKDARQKWRAENKPSRPSHPRIGRIVASRELTDAKNPKRRIVVALGAPRQVDSMEWECKLHIDGLEPIMHQISGVDSMQALLLGVEALRLSLKRSPYRLARPDDGIPCPAGDIPLQVPSALGEEFAERIERLIDREAPRLLKIRGEMIRSHILQANKTRGGSHERAPSRKRRSE